MNVSYREHTGELLNQFEIYSAYIFALVRFFAKVPLQVKIGSTECLFTNIQIQVY